MEDNFSRARLDSISKKKYEVKVLKIRTAKQFLVEYHSGKRDKRTLQQATLNYDLIHQGKTSYHISEIDRLRNNGCSNRKCV